eukprot:766481-Hanusia_phi.AAC.2
MQTEHGNLFTYDKDAHLGRGELWRRLLTFAFFLLDTSSIRMSPFILDELDLVAKLAAFLKATNSLHHLWIIRTSSLVQDNLLAKSLSNSSSISSLPRMVVSLSRGDRTYLGCSCCERQVSYTHEVQGEASYKYWSSPSSLLRCRGTFSPQGQYCHGIIPSSPDSYKSYSWMKSTRGSDGVSDVINNGYPAALVSNRKISQRWCVPTPRLRLNTAFFSDLRHVRAHCPTLVRS